MRLPWTRLGPRRFGIAITSRAIRRTMQTIWSQRLPASRHEVADAPDFERYAEEIDPRTGNGGLEIWIPLKA